MPPRKSNVSTISGTADEANGVQVGKERDGINIEVSSYVLFAVKSCICFKKVNSNLRWKYKRDRQMSNCLEEFEGYERPLRVVDTNYLCIIRICDC